MKFNIGDKVRIIDCQRGDDDQRWNLSMSKYIGTVAEIQRLSKYNKDFYYLKNNVYGWHKSWLGLINRKYEDFITEDEMSI